MRRVPFLVLVAVALAQPMRAQVRAPAVPDDAQALVEALKAAAVPLAGGEDLAPLLALIGDARAVLLGEASHGTSEFYSWRASISRALIEERAFRFLAVEGDWAACRRVQRYIQGEDDAGTSAREVLLSFDRWPRWMWANEEMVELVEWLREHNRERPPEERVGFYGLDIYGAHDSLAKIPRYVRELDPELVELAERRLACFVTFAGRPQAYVNALRTGGSSCEAALVDLVEVLRERGAAHRGRNAQAQFHAKQNALVLRSAERHYRTMLRQDAQSWNARASHFHLTLERLLEHYGPDSRGVVWAHNTHIGDARATPMAGAGRVNVGQLIRQSLGPQEVRLIGFATHRGRLLAARGWEAARQEMELPRAQEGSLEDLLERAGLVTALLAMEALSEVPALRRALPQRAVGVTYDPDTEQRGNYVPSILPERYDALIFLAETRALAPLHEHDGGAR